MIVYHCILTFEIEPEEGETKEQAIRRLAIGLAENTTDDDFYRDLMETAEEHQI